MSDVNATQLWASPLVIRLVGPDGVAQIIDRPLIAGRGPDVDFLIQDEFASRRHAKLVPGPDCLQVEDLGSVNGTFLNGERKSQFTARNGDTITFNIARYTLEIGAAKAEKPAPDIDATRLHAPGSMAAKEAPTPKEPPTPKEIADPATKPAPEVAKPALSDDGKAPAAKEPPQAMPKAERAWWETSNEGPSKTMLIQPGQAPGNLELTRMLNLGPADQPRLVITVGSGAGTCFPLKEGKTSIGRDSQCDILIEDNGVSSKHAQIIHESGTWKLVNLLSSNGTFVNGERIQTAYLNSGDELRLGPVGLMFQLPGATAKGTSVGKGQVAAKASAAKEKSGSAGIIAAIVGFVVVLAVAGWFLL